MMFQYSEQVLQMFNLLIYYINVSLVHSPIIITLGESCIACD